MPLVALPPNALCATRDNIAGLKVTILFIVPTSCNIGMLAFKIVESLQHAMPGAIRAIQPLLSSLMGRHLPFVTALTNPPGLPAGIWSNSPGPKAQITLMTGPTSTRG